MKKTRKKLESMLNAISFAESGEHETARQFLAHEADEASMKAGSGSSDLAGFLENSMDRPMAAATFAQAGLLREASNLMRNTKNKTVLLVIEGESPTQAAFNYASNLCARTNAQMDILQIVAPSSGSDSFDLLGQRMSCAVTNVVNLLKKCDMQKAMPKLTIRLGEVDSKLLNYVRRHREVSAIVFDSPETSSTKVEQTRSKGFLESLSKRLSVPLMAVLERRSVEANG